MTWVPMQHLDFNDADPTITVGQLVDLLSTRDRSWPVEIYVVGDRVVHLGIEIEDIAFEHGKCIITTGSAGQVIHIEPATWPEGLTKEAVEEAMRGKDAEVSPEDLPPDPFDNPASDDG